MATFYEGLRRGPEDTVEDKLKATAKYFGIRPSTVKAHLKFWWPGSRFLQEFSHGDGRRRGRRWDRPAPELVEALNRHRTVAKTAKALKTTPITLTKRIQEKGIREVWVLEE